MNNMKLEIGKLYNVSRPIISTLISISSNIEFIADQKAKHDCLIRQYMLLSDKIELSWNGHAYKILTETGDVGYILENSNFKLVFTAIS